MKMHNLNALYSKLATLWELREVLASYENCDKAAPTNVLWAVENAEKAVSSAVNVLWPTLKLSEAKQLVTRFEELDLNIRNYLHI